MTNTSNNPMGDKPTTHFGTVAIVGRPNVGKSTLLNAILGQKISITCRKPQTTRHQVLGIYTEDDYQLVFVDTPGIHKKKPKALNHYMNQNALAVLNDVDVVLWVVEGSKHQDDDDWVMKQLKNSQATTVIAVNKVDNVKDKASLLPYLQRLQSETNAAKAF